MSDEIPTVGADTLPEGEWAILELFGHQTLVGRMAEVERFGAKMLALEVLFNGVMLPPVFHGGAAIYRLTPCSAAVAWAWACRHNNTHYLPESIRETLPPKALPPGQLPLDLDSVEIGGVDREDYWGDRESDHEEF